MEEPTKIETPTQETKKEFVQGEKSETVEKALQMMRDYRKKCDTATSKEQGDVDRYEFPKMMKAILAAEIENVARREKGEREFIFEKSDEFKAMLGKKDTHIKAEGKNELGTLIINGTDKYGINEEHIARQRELALEEVKKAKILQNAAGEKGDGRLS